MAEISNNAAILIATSFQVLKRAETGDRSTMISNCIVTILFASFFIEENLDFIIKKMGKTQDMKKFMNKKKREYLGLLDKIAWYYNCYAANPKAENRDSLYTGRLMRKLEKRFPGFSMIYQFRNDIAHGKINRSANFKDTEKLRIQAKSIVDELIVIAEQAGYEIPRKITYSMAIADSEEQLTDT